MAKQPRNPRNGVSHTALWAQPVDPATARKEAEAFLDRVRPELKPSTRQTKLWALDRLLGIYGALAVPRAVCDLASLQRDIRALPDSIAGGQPHHRPFLVRAALMLHAAYGGYDAERARALLKTRVTRTRPATGNPANTDHVADAKADGAASAAIGHPAPAVDGVSPRPAQLDANEEECQVVPAHSGVSVVIDLIAMAARAQHSLDRLMQSTPPSLDSLIDQHADRLSDRQRFQILHAIKTEVALAGIAAQHEEVSLSDATRKAIRAAVHARPAFELDDQSAANPTGTAASKNRGGRRQTAARKTAYLQA